jgi:hypothetical protein
MEDWMTMYREDMNRAKNARLTEDEAVAACRDWYDWKGYGKPFCCFMVLQTDNGEKKGGSNVVDATSTIKADSITFDNKQHDFGA